MLKFHSTFPKYIFKYLYFHQAKKIQLRKKVSKNT